MRLINGITIIDDNHDHDDDDGIIIIDDDDNDDYGDDDDDDENTSCSHLVFHRTKTYLTTCLNINISAQLYIRSLVTVLLFCTCNGISERCIWKILLSLYGCTD